MDFRRWYGSQEGSLPIQTSTATVQPVDFRRSERLSPAQIRTLCTLHENFARDAGPSLSAYLRSSVTLSVSGVAQACGAEFLRELPAPCCLAVYRVPPDDCHAVLDINPAVAFPMLELLLGGTGKAPPDASRKMTAIERKLFGGILDIVARDLKEAWSGEQRIELVLDYIETDPLTLRVISAADGFVLITMELCVGETSGAIRLAVPFAIFKSLQPASDPGHSGAAPVATQAERERNLRSIQAAKLELEARLDGPTVPFADLMALRPGSLISLAHPVDRPLECVVNQTVRYRGQVVGSGGKRAFLIEER